MPRPLPKLEEDINNHFDKQDKDMMTWDDQLEEYNKQYHQKLQYNEHREVVGVAFVRVENRMIKVDVFPITEPPRTYNPLELNKDCSDGSFYFLEEYIRH